MIYQLKSREGVILHQQPQGLLFPDYRSVLEDALTKNIDLTGLSLKDEDLSNLKWIGVRATELYFKNCSLTNNRFEDCRFNYFSLQHCDCSHSVFKDTDLRYGHWSNLILDHVRFLTMPNMELFIIDCSCKAVLFRNCNLSHITFHSVNLTQTTFKNSRLGYAAFINAETTNSWMDEVSFLNCKIGEVQFHKYNNLRNLYFWKTRIVDIDFAYCERPVIFRVENPSCIVVYCVDQDVLWWKPEFWAGKSPRIWRSGLQEFEFEIKNTYPKTQVLQSPLGAFVDEELQLVCSYFQALKAHYRPSLA
ncbi:pentapeptide repeat-containing protein [Leeuwenhoekiella parthenopeia]|uniref:Pentapeptide repeat-containing protein n=1 Tax=Leeuwenhoekiella parthenopeia TaxID=2890320 RepID=A0ABS8GWL3_9FLAO|nr:pentapeptide repeat-containing protein [Leeuwenhoekiella parthenopeia]MCC4214410.1 pentapeptide repeat-containing protein [Leeuwenhoekiella parthenopeia]